jgi:hypothetical protein
MQQERAVILIDGRNFYFKLRDLKLHQLLTFHFSSFAHSLIGKGALMRPSYFVRKVRTDGSENANTMKADQQRLFAHLIQQRSRYLLPCILCYAYFTSVRKVIAKERARTDQSTGKVSERKDSVVTSPIQYYYSSTPSQ